MSGFVYQRAKGEPALWTVGFYHPDGAWITDSDHEVREAAAVRCHWLNGGNSVKATAEYLEPLIRGENVVRDILEAARIEHSSMEVDVIELTGAGHQKGISEADQQNARVRDEREASPDGMTDAERAMQARRDPGQRLGPQRADDEPQPAEDPRPDMEDDRHGSAEYRDTGEG